MPLIILSGFPCSGLTTRARELEQAFKSRTDGPIKKVVVIDDSSLDVSKDQYKERDPEKAARGAQMAAVQRNLSPSTIVILDNMSYIKGFRYQLFCEAKAIQTTSCVVHVGTPADTCAVWNRKRPDGEKWDEELLKALIFRYEEPNSLNRWDSPLFILLPQDELPIDEIWDCLVHRKPPKPNAATTLKPAAPASYLSLLNETASRITKQIMDVHRDAPGAEMTIAGRTITLPYRLSIAQMNRIKRNFVQLNKSAQIAPDNVETFFVDFVVNNWDID